VRHGPVLTAWKHGIMRFSQGRDSPVDLLQRRTLRLSVCPREPRWCPQDSAPARAELQSFGGQNSGNSKPALIVRRSSLAIAELMKDMTA